MEYAPLLIVLTLATLAHYVTVGRYEGVLTLDGIFVVTQWILNAGTLTLLDPSNDADRLYAVVVSLPMLLYILTSIIVHWAQLHGTTRVRSGMGRRVVPYEPTLAVWALLVLSALVSTAYFRAVGYNVLLLAIQNMFSNQTADYTTLRLASYNGSTYLFPGYVNQFKNTILPSLALVASLHLFATRSSRRFLVAVPLILISIISILGTGQRGAFIQFSLAFVTFLFFINRRRFPRRAAIVGLATAPFLLLSTLILGRSASSLEQDAGPVAHIATLGQELLRRIFRDNQLSGQMGFRLTYGQPIQNGQEWLSGARGILPGDSGSTLPRQIFASMYGSDRGTAPPSIWGSTFYNFGWLGLVVLPIVLAIIYRIVTARGINKPSVNTLELVGMSGTFVICGNWIAGSPDYLLNAGGLTFAILWWMGRHAAPSPGLSRQDGPGEACADSAGKPVRSGSVPAPLRASHLPLRPVNGPKKRIRSAYRPGCARDSNAARSLSGSALNNPSRTRRPS